MAGKPQKSPGPLGDLVRKTRALGELHDLGVDPSPLDWQELAELTAAAEAACRKCPTLKQIHAVCVNGDKHLREVMLIGELAEKVLSA